MLRDFLTALSQTKLPLRIRIVLLLAAVEADQRPIFVAERELMRSLGIRQRRRLTPALGELTEMRMVERVAGVGSRPTLYRLRPGEDWVGPRWAVERPAALRTVAVVRDARAQQRALYAQPEPGALGTFVRRGESGAQITRCAQGRKRRTNLDLARLETLRTNDAGDGALTVSLEREESLSLSQGVREGVSDLEEVLKQRCGVTGVWGQPRRRLERIVMEANGNLPRVMAAAGAPGGPDKLLERIGYLEGVMTAPLLELPREQSLVYIEEENRWALRDIDPNDQAAGTVKPWPVSESEP